MPQSCSGQLPYLWIDASNCRDGGGVTHLIQVVPRLADYWAPGKVKVYAGFHERQLLSMRSEVLELPDIPELDQGLLRRLQWQHYGYPNLVRRDDQSGVAFALGGLLTGQFAEHISTITMCRNMLPFEWGEAFRYKISKALLRLVLLNVGQKRSFQRANGVIFLSKYAKEILESSLSERVERAIIPHGIGNEFRHLPDVQRIPQSLSKLLYVSPIDVYKHQCKVVEALNLLVGRGHDLSLDLVGGEYLPARKRLDKIVHRTQQQNRVNILGKIGHEDLPKVYQQADIFVFASSCENFPNILLEAMASGIPIACSDRGPMPEVTRGAVAYFDPENPVSIADAIERLIRDPKLRLQYAKQAFEIASEYSWDQCAQQTADFLFKVWERNQP